jgi:N-acetylglucosamine-6-sulfatase
MGFPPPATPRSRRGSRRSRSLRRAAVLIATVAVAATGFATAEPAPRPSRALEGPPPDVVVIVTDDQRFDGMGQMPKTRAWLPARFPSAFVTTPVCCPSRTTILTGLYAHDSGVWANEGTYGGWPRFLSQGWPGQTIADRLQAAGYRTGLFGKFLNDWDGTIPPGWDDMAAHLSSRTRRTPTTTTR